MGCWDLAEFEQVKILCTDLVAPELRTGNWNLNQKLNLNDGGSKCGVNTISVAVQ